ncbi:hypothetical protein B7494_g1307 [Chlorociboria aeruginascens]|nr:hypothetical protein B7494_g1307 [Chlorociboria aeruginascens]
MLFLRFLNEVCLTSCCRTTDEEDGYSTNSDLRPLLDRSPLPQHMRRSITTPMPAASPMAIPRRKTYGSKRPLATPAASAMFGSSLRPRSPLEDITNSIGQLSFRSDNNHEVGDNKETRKKKKIDDTRKSRSKKGTCNNKYPTPNQSTPLINSLDENYQPPSEGDFNVSEEIDNVPEELKEVLKPLRETYEQDTGTQIQIADWKELIAIDDQGTSIQKIAEASYAEVYRITNDHGSSILKLMQLKVPSDPYSFDLQTAVEVENVVSEIRIMNALTTIPGFVHFKAAHILQGAPPTAVINAYDLHHEHAARESEFPHPTEYSQFSVFLALELGDAGHPLEEETNLTSILDVWQIFLSVVLALSRAENEARFEHRDLHENNICISRPANNTAIELPTKLPERLKNLKFGFSPIEVTLLDYGLSRATLPATDTIVHFNLEQDLCIFRGASKGKGSFQYDTYRRMRTYLFTQTRTCEPKSFHTEESKKKSNGHTWEEYIPYTNVLWIRFLLHYLISSWKGERGVLRKFRGEVKVLQEMLDPHEEVGFETAGEVLDFAIERGWIHEWHLEVDESLDKMAARSILERVTALFRKSQPDQIYERLDTDSNSLDSDVQRPVLADKETPFSWFEYSIFLLLGIAMLWAWNMFLAAAPYFQTRFQDNEAILNHFQPAITSIGTITNLASMLVLTNMQSKASYPKRIIHSLIFNVVIFTLLTLSTKWFLSISAAGYLAFTLIMVFSTSVATGLCQNGAFAFASSFGRREYIQAIMMGQALAGVLPSVASIISVLVIPESNPWADKDTETTSLTGRISTSAFIYFLTATVISAITLLGFLPLIQKRNHLMEGRMVLSVTSIEEVERSSRKVVGMVTLYNKLYWFVWTAFLCFAITMFFPVFTGKVVSIVPIDQAPRLLQPAVFIPIGFLVWNCGDLSGRLLTIIPVRMGNRPELLFLISILRVGFLPLYFLCNIQNEGAIIKSDAFYLFIVQFGFGLTNGWLASTTMMGAVEWVEEDEREVTGSFMAVNLMAGLTAGSLLSFAVPGAT